MSKPRKRYAITAGILTCKKCGKSGDASRLFKLNTAFVGGYQSVCRDCHKAATAKWRAANPEKVRAYNAKHDWGLPLEVVDTLRAAPCEACGKAGPNVIDHCHRTDKIRGTLCDGCNRAFGMLYESLDTLAGLVRYAIKHNGIPDANSPPATSQAG